MIVYSALNIQTEETALDNVDYDTVINFLNKADEPANYHITEWEFEDQYENDDTMWEINEQWFGDEFLSNDED